MVDLGCGAGNLTALLAQRWPGARVQGVDSSPEMIAAASVHPGIEFSVGDLRDWLASAGSTGEQVDVLVSNAVLQWVPGHLDLLPDLVGAVSPGGWLAFQVPGNFAEPSHTIRRDLAAEPAYAGTRGGRGHPGRGRRGDVPPGAARPRVRGGRLGDDVPARARGP